MTEATFAIYKAYADNDEMSKSLAMKNVLGWSDEQIKENFMSLIKDKQITAIADYFADKVSADNPPVDFKSPIRLKNDVDEKDKIFSGNSQESKEGGEEGAESGNEEATSGEEGSSEEQEEPAPEPSEPPTFGLG